jgi:protein TonB
MFPASLRESAPAPAALAILAIALTLAACSKGEPESSKPRANAPLQMPKPSEQAPVAVESSESLRERLARQEAASRMFDKPDPPKPARIEPPAPAPAKTPPANVDPPKPVASRPEPPKAEAPKIEPPTVEPPKPEAKAPAPPPPRTEIAAAKPAAPVNVVRLVTRVDPEFPREAVQAGADNGAVKARLTLDAAGGVTRVEVVEAVPRRIFDRAVVRALSQWKYNEGTAGRLVDVEVAFKR